MARPVAGGTFRAPVGAQVTHWEAPTWPGAPYVPLSVPSPYVPLPVYFTWKSRLEALGRLTNVFALEIDRPVRGSAKLKDDLPSATLNVGCLG